MPAINGSINNELISQSNSTLITVESGVELIEERGTEVEVTNALRRGGESEEQFVRTIGLFADVISRSKNNVDVLFVKTDESESDIVESFETGELFSRADITVLVT